ncbi:MAG: glycosyltransferase family 39 protein [Planctomycetes bacterium]|jgi:hypothetical protein|nr:glycosyltransferase family 39 protein [Planctomycetota bacterium]
MPPPTKPAPLRPSRHGTGVALVLLAGAVRAVAAAGAALVPNDSIALLTTARAVSGGDLSAAFTGLLHPLPPLVIGLLGGSEAAGLSLSIAAGALGTLAVFGIGLRLGSRSTGAVAAVLYAVAPALARLAGAPLSEGLSVPLSLFAVERALRALEAPRAALPAGLLAGLAYLCRPEAILLPAVLFPALALARLSRPALLLLFGFLVLAGPYAGWLSATSGTLTVTRKKPIGRFLRAEEDFDRKMAVKEARLGVRRPGAGAAAAETLRTYGDAAAFVLPPLALVGLWFHLRRGRREIALVLAALVLLTVVVNFRLLWLHGYLERRHMAVPAALTIPLAAAGLAVLARRRAPVAAAVLAALLLVPAVRPRDRDKLPLKDAGRHILAEGGPGAVVATHLAPRIAFYAGGRDYPLHREWRGPASASDTRGSADWLALCPRRLAPDRLAGYLSILPAPARDPDRIVGEGEWTVHLWRLR